MHKVITDNVWMCENMSITRRPPFTFNFVLGINALFDVAMKLYGQRFISN